MLIERARQRESEQPEAEGQDDSTDDGPEDGSDVGLEDGSEHSMEHLPFAASAQAQVSTINSIPAAISIAHAVPITSIAPAVPLIFASM